MIETYSGVGKGIVLFVPAGQSFNAAIPAAGGSFELHRSEDLSAWSVLPAAASTVNAGADASYRLVCTAHDGAPLSVDVSVA